MGLVNAVIRFDVNAGSDFVSFAVPTIMGEVRRHFRDNSWSVKVPRRLKELHLRLGAATAELSQRLGRAPTARELAAELEMDRDEVIEGRLRAAPTTHCRSTAVAAATRMRPRSPTRSEMSTRAGSDRESRSVAALAGCAAGAGAHRAGAAVLRVDDADSDCRAGRHLADARLPVVWRSP